MAAKKEIEYRFLLVGKSGSGKSSTANTIMGEKLFVTSTGLAAGTPKCEVRKSTKPQKGVTFRIVDTPGLFDPDKSNKEIGDEVIKAAANVHPGLHAVLYVLKADRYTPEEQAIFNQLKKIFDANVVKYVVIIFSRGDELQKQKITMDALLKQANQHFQQVLQECGNRVVIFNNMKQDSKQTRELLEIVDKVWKENGEVPYFCPIQEIVNEKLEKRVDVRMEERIKTDPATSKKFSGMAERAKNAKKEAEDQRRILKDTLTKKEMTESQIAEKKLAKEKSEQERKQREQEEKEQQERAEKEKVELEEKKKQEEEEKERRQRDQELMQLQKELETIKKDEKEIERLEKDKRKVQEDCERKLDEEKTKLRKEEMEKTKEDIVEDKESKWTRHVWRGAIRLMTTAVRGLMSWWGF